MIWFVAYVVLFLIFYKIIEYLIRIPRVGNYSSRYILVTGCDTGFGNSIVKRLDQLGCHVFAGCYTETGETDLKKSCSDRLHVVSMDVSNHESIEKAFAYVVDKLPKGKGLWGVLNNAGVLLDSGAPDWLSVSDFKRPCDINLWGLIDVTLTFLPLVKIERGRVVNVASAAGRISVPIWLPYCVSKYGVEAFTDGIRRSMYYFGCKASLIEPGIHKTSIVDKERLIKTVTQAWQKAPAKVKAEYGDEYSRYEKEIDKMLDFASDRCTDVTDAYEHALFARFPRERYLIGFDAKYVFIPVQALPEWLGDWILRVINPGPSLPVVGKKQKLEANNN